MDLCDQSSFFFFILSVFVLTLSTITVTSTDTDASGVNHRRILHQPFFPVTSAPPPTAEIPPPPPPSSPDQDLPFFPEIPATTDQSQQPPPSPPSSESAAENGGIPVPRATQPTKPAKKIAIAISVGVATFALLSVLIIFMFRYGTRKKPSESQKLVNVNGGRDMRFPENSRTEPSSFPYVGTVEPNRRGISEVSGENETNASPYKKLDSVKGSDRFRTSPELQPLPPLAKTPPPGNSMSAITSSSSSDWESRDSSFHKPRRSSFSNDSYYIPVSRSVINNNGPCSGGFPHSKRTSPRSRLAGDSSSPEMKLDIIPSVKQQLLPEVPSEEVENHRQLNRPKFSQLPPPPNMGILRSLNNDRAREQTKIPTPPPPPLPLQPPWLPVPQTSQRVNNLETNGFTKADKPSKTRKTWLIPNHEGSSIATVTEPVEESIRDEEDGVMARLKPLHWDKVRATSDKATVWDQLKSSSFRLNEVAMEHLFGFNSTNSAPKDPIGRSVLPPLEQNRVLDPKKSQNIAILLRALNVTRDEVSEALLDGNSESLGPELLETLVRMAPTKEEEIKLREYSGDISKLGAAERFLKTILDVPFAFKRVEAMLYRANFDSEVKYLTNSFQTLEEACEELKNSKLFLKLLEAVLRTGNRMNIGTNRGDAKAFKLHTLLKLADIKGTDGKTTLLHFVVQEITRTEEIDTNPRKENLQNSEQSYMKDNEFSKQGLQVVAHLSKDLSNVKKAAGMDSHVLSGYLSKLETGLQRVRSVLQYNKPDSIDNFFDLMKIFLRDAEEEISMVKAYERNALLLVKQVTEYFHGDTAKEEAHPFRIFMVVRDFLSILDHVCKEMGKSQDRTVVGSARSFRIPAPISLPVLNRHNVRRDRNPDEEVI